MKALHAHEPGGMPMAVRLEGVSKRYGSGQRGVRAVDGVDLAIREGEFLSLVGPSGSGKSTLLNLIAGLDRPTEGRVVLFGRELAGLSDDERARLRLAKVGFVFQAFHLFPTLTVEENVLWPLEFLGVRNREARRRATEMLDQLQVPNAAHGRRPQELSGGEQQRVAVARAIVTEPVIVLADEPTGNLDSQNGSQILELLRELNGGKRVTVVMVTHSPAAAAYADRMVAMRDGCIDAGTDTAVAGAS